MGGTLSSNEGKARRSLATLQAVRVQNPDWRSSHLLGRLTISKDLEDRLTEIVRLGIEDEFNRLEYGVRTDWGAALMLLGTLALRDRKAESADYGALGSALEIPNLKGNIGQYHWAALGRGAAWWGIEVLRNRGNRRMFLGTMLGHSGQAWPLMQSAATLISKRWSWEGVRTSASHDVDEWLKAHTKELSTTHSKALGHGETRAALAHALVQLATVARQLELGGFDPRLRG